MFSSELKAQLQQAENSPRKRFNGLVEESRRAAEEDKASLRKEAEEVKKHKEFLSRFRDDNKMVSTTVLY